MVNNDIAVQYANALAQLAIEAKLESNLRQDVLDLKQAFDEDEQFSLFYFSNNIDADDKKEVIKKIFNKKINEYLLNLLLYLIDNNDEKNIPLILVKFVEILNQDLSIIELKIFSPFELDQAVIKKIQTQVEIKTNKKTNATLVIDKELIGGIKISYNNIVYDNSIKSKIDSIKANLRKR